MSAPITKMSEDRLVIAVDFGTTFSGVAYAFNIAGKKADITPIQDWPEVNLEEVYLQEVALRKVVLLDDPLQEASTWNIIPLDITLEHPSGSPLGVTADCHLIGLEGYRQPKVPTLIMYDEKDPSKFKWGGQVNWRDPAVRGVKLMLDPDQDRPAYFPASTFKKDPHIFSKAPIDVAADFIGAIYKHALSVVEDAGLRDYVNFCQKDFVLSVPAVWSDKAKDLTMKAARKAGIHPVALIKEPEAAALYTLTTHDHAIKPGDGFVVCDAGGGTVDLIAYGVDKIEPRLHLSELVPGKGGMVGSLGINKRFEEAVRDLVGEDQFYHLKKTIGWSKALNDFDKNIKTAFNGDVDDVHYVSFPKANLKDDDVEGLSGNCWEMSGKTLQNIFEPVIKDILRLVDEVVQGVLAKRGGQGVKAIFLVGGFGSSRYLKVRLDRIYKPRGIQVIQPHNAWGAIVNGAVLSRLSDQATVTSTKAVRHYGTNVWCDYNPQTDHGQVTRRRPYDGKLRCEKLDWFIYKGADLNRDEIIKLPFFYTLKEHYTPSDLVFREDLFYSEANDAPVYPGPQVKSCCTAEADLSTLTRKDLRKIRGVDGNLYYRVHFNLVLCTAAANLKFSLEFKGKEMGSVEASYV